MNENKYCTKTDCAYYNLYKMITTDSYNYYEEIPCLTCKHYVFTEDNYATLKIQVDKLREILEELREEILVNHQSESLEQRAYWKSARAIDQAEKEIKNLRLSEKEMVKVLKKELSYWKLDRTNKSNQYRDGSCPIHHIIARKLKKAQEKKYKRQN